VELFFFFFEKTNDLIKLRLDALRKYIHVVLYIGYIFALGSSGSVE